MTFEEDICKALGFDPSSTTHLVLTLAAGGEPAKVVVEEILDGEKAEELTKAIRRYELRPKLKEAEG